MLRRRRSLDHSHWPRLIDDVHLFDNSHFHSHRFARRPGFHLTTPCCVSNLPSPRLPVLTFVVFRTMCECSTESLAFISQISSSPVACFYFGSLSSRVDQTQKNRLGLSLLLYSGLVYINTRVLDRKSTRLNSSHSTLSRMPSSA